MNTQDILTNNMIPNLDIDMTGDELLSFPNNKSATQLSKGLLCGVFQNKFILS
ncbi:hypothetical protein J2Y02_002144 [Neobacillus drentensis]|nr:hypothetical protein [Neobacillus drentensis]